MSLQAGLSGRLSLVSEAVAPPERPEVCCDDSAAEVAPVVLVEDDDIEESGSAAGVRNRARRERKRWRRDCAESARLLDAAEKVLLVSSRPVSS